MDRSHPSPDRAGWTLVELLVVLGVLALLFALIVPAVQWSRAAARATHCRNNLKQIGLGLHSYHAAYRCFPAGSMNGFSPHVAILPFIEQTALYEQIDFSESFWLSPTEKFEPMLTTGVDLYRCPDSSSAHRQKTSYVATNGTGLLFGGENGIFIVPQTTDPELIRASRVTDGLSNTVAFSETINASRSDPRGQDLVTSRRYADGEGEVFRSECLAIEASDSTQPSRLGGIWMGGGQAVALYVHTLRPNTRNCRNGTTFPSGIWSASSRHSGGVNALLADGTVRFVGDAIDREIWRAAATRAGGESGPSL